MGESWPRSWGHQSVHAIDRAQDSPNTDRRQYFCISACNLCTAKHLYRSRFQPIKFVNSVVPSPCETRPCNNDWYFQHSNKFFHPSRPTTLIIIHWTRYLFSDWPKAYSEFSKSAPVTSFLHFKITSNRVKFARFVLLAVSEEAKTWRLFFSFNVQ